jgi:hypothetical protein
MASNIPITRSIAWISLVPQIALMGLLILVFHLMGVNAAHVFGGLTYLLLSIGLRNLIGMDHRKGMTLIKQHQFENAIPRFEASVEFFTKYSWVDKYRYLTLLSSSKMTYREMGLCNIAFCYGQIGQGAKARAFYEQVRTEYPDNGIALIALNLMSSVEHGESVQTGKSFE